MGEKGNTENKEYIELRARIENLNILHAKSKILIINTLVHEYGTRVYEVLVDGIGLDTIRMFEDFGSKTKERTIEDLIKILWEPLKKDGFEYTIENTSSGTQMKCTKCPYAEVYKSLNSTRIGYILYCAQDAFLMEGFNKNIGFRRTKTIMEGDEYCDHFYYMK
jgi:predicted ArsR family transcriptional regulator